MSLDGLFSSFACGPWSQGGFGHGWFGGYGHGAFGHGGFGMGSGAWFGSLHFPFGLLTLVLLAMGAFWIFSRSRTPVRQESPDALELLKRRYASGAIDREEYRRQRDDLEK